MVLINDWFRPGLTTISTFFTNSETPLIAQHSLKSAKTQANINDQKLNSSCFWVWKLKGEDKAAKKCWNMSQLHPAKAQCLQIPDSEIPCELFALLTSCQTVRESDIFNLKTINQWRSDSYWRIQTIDTAIFQSQWSMKRTTFHSGLPQQRIKKTAFLASQLLLRSPPFYHQIDFNNWVKVPALYTTLDQYLWLLDCLQTPFCIKLHHSLNSDISIFLRQTQTSLD